MSSTLDFPHSAAARGQTGLPSFGMADPVGRQVPTRESDAQFIAMLNVYRASGGLARAQEVAAMCRCAGTGLGTLAQQIIERKVVCLEWQSRIWLPLFQFQRPGMTLLPGLGAVLSELVAIYDDWDIANWFSRPNPWLADCTPADALLGQECTSPPDANQSVMHRHRPGVASEVLNAARAERYVAAG
jgi:hypothetical protein